MSKETYTVVFHNEFEVEASGEMEAVEKALDMLLDGDSVEDIPASVYDSEGNLSETFP